MPNFDNNYLSKYKRSISSIESSKSVYPIALNFSALDALADAAASGRKETSFVHFTKKATKELTKCLIWLKSLRISNI